MSLRLVCPKCQAVYNDIPDDAVGKSVRCKQCEHRWIVTADNAPTAIVAEMPAAELILPADTAPAATAIVAEEVRPVAKRPRRARDYDDYDDDRRSSRSRRRSNPVLLFLFLGFMGLGLLTALGVGIYFLYDLVSDAGKPPAPPIAQGSPAPPFPGMFPGQDDPDDDKPDEKGKIVLDDKAPVDLLAPTLLPAAPFLLDSPPPDVGSPVGQNPAASKDGQLPPDVLQKVKKATAFVRVTRPDNLTGSGSGFFAFERGIVITNAHVVGMLNASAKAPQKIEIIINSGEPDEKTFIAKLIGLDRRADLAVVRVTGKDMPEPLSISSARELHETQTVYIFGFPLGERLGKSMTVTTSSVSSLRREKGLLHRVQLHGGLVQGNSGGPVVDVQGRVIGVSVEMIGSTEIKFAVPGDLVHGLVHGRIIDMACGQPYLDGTNIKIPVTLDILDPLKRIKSAKIDWWLGTGAVGATRPPSASQPGAVAGETARQSITLKYAQGKAEGELILPWQKDKTYWLQPWTQAGAETSRRWATAIAYQPPLPVERKSVLLTVKHQAGNDIVDLNLKTNQRISSLQGGFADLMTHSGVSMAETRQAPDNDGAADLQLQFKTFLTTMSVNNQHNPFPTSWKPIFENMKHVKSRLSVDARGNLLNSHLDTNEVPGAYQAGVHSLSMPMQRTLETILVPLPCSKVEPNAHWTAERNLTIATSNNGRFYGGMDTETNATADLIFSYEGVRRRDNNEEVVVALEGKLRGAEPSKTTGNVSGFALIDLASGRVTLERAKIDYALETGAGFRGSESSGTMEVQLRRTSKNP